MPILNDAVRSCARLVALKLARDLRVVRFGNEVETSFTLSDIRNGTPGTEITAWLNRARWPHPATQPCVYVIAAETVPVAHTLARAFDQDRARPNRLYKLPKPNNDTERSQTLYVGSSQGIRPRLKQHLFRTNESTYAMNMQRWCPAGDGIVTVTVQPILENDDADVMQALEDTLWKILRPRFGKLGAK